MRSVTDVILAGVGGQGTVLAAKVLATAAARRGCAVRTAETIGMSQRGGSVVSHVRIAPADVPIRSSLVTHGCADVVIAFEPGEAARALSYLAPGGTLVTATTPVEPVSASLSGEGYDVAAMLERIARVLEAPATGCALGAPASVADVPEGVLAGSAPSCDSAPARLVAIDDACITSASAGGRKVLNTVMLAAATELGCLPFEAADLKAAIAACVKAPYVAMNQEAADVAARHAASLGTR